MHWYVGADGRVLSAPAGTGALLYGYGVYTTFRYPLPERLLRAHLDRLAHDAALLGLQSDSLAGFWDSSRIREALRQAANQAAGSLGQDPEFLREGLEPERKTGGQVVRLSLMADVDSYNDFAPGRALPGRLILSIRDAHALRQSQDLTNAASLKSINYLRPVPGIKLAAIADVLHFRRSLPPGYDDVLLVSPEGVIAEAGTANIFFVRDGVLLTPEPERDGCLPGIIRRRVLETAQEQGIRVSTETPLKTDNLADLDGAFLTNAVQGIVPIRRIDETEFSWPDPVIELMRHLQETLE